jgi:hypothetical protein
MQGKGSRQGCSRRCLWQNGHGRDQFGHSMGKGKGLGALDAWEEQPWEEQEQGAEPEQELGGIDLCALHRTCIEEKPWHMANVGKRWVKPRRLQHKFDLQCENKYEALDQQENPYESIGIRKKSEVQDVDGVGESYAMKVSATIDSGAALNVMPSTWFQDYPLRVTKENGTKYRAANGQLINDEGLRSLSAVMRHDKSRTMRKVNCRVTQVNKMLLAVSKIVDAGHDVHFSKEASYIVNHKTKEKLYLRREAGVYVLDMEVMSSGSGHPGSILSSVDKASDFIRQGKAKP